MSTPFLLFLLVCITQSTYSATENHALYKRMEPNFAFFGLDHPNFLMNPSSSVGQVSQILKPKTEGFSHINEEQLRMNPGPGTNSDKKEVTLNDQQQRNTHEGAENPPQNPAQPSGDRLSEVISAKKKQRKVSFNPQSETIVLKDPPVPPTASPQKWETAKNRMRLWNPFKGLRQKLYNFFDGIRWNFKKFIRKLSPQKSIHSAFEEPFKRYEGLSRLRDNLEHEKLSEDLITEIFSNPSRYAKNPEKLDASSIKEVRETLKDVRHFNEHFRIVQKVLASNTQQIEKKIKPILGGRKSPATTLPKLGKQLARYQATNLKYDRKAIRIQMYDLENIHVPNIIDFLGPGNVLFQEALSMLNKGIESGKYTIVSHLNGESIMKEIEKLQNQLQEVAIWNREEEFAWQQGRRLQRPLESFVKIKEQHAKLVQSFGKPTEFLDFINDFDESAIRQSLRKDQVLSSAQGYELYLIEPWGITRTIEKIPFEKLPYVSINHIIGRLSAWKTLESLAELAHENVQMRLRATRGSIEIEDKLREFLSTDAILHISNSLSKLPKS